MVEEVGAGVGALGFRDLSLLRGLLVGVGRRFLLSGRRVRWGRGLIGSVVFVRELGGWLELDCIFMRGAKLSD